MTICIGALTLTGPSIVLGADTRVTHGNSPVGPNDQAGKQYPLPYDARQPLRARYRNVLNSWADYRIEKM
jgi:hypothetical protein